MSSINFDNPYLLLLAIPLVILFAIPFFIAVRRDNVNGHNIASGIIHVFMALLIAFAAAGTSVITTVTETDVYVLADVSYSANRNYDLIDDYIEDLRDSLPNNSRLGVICFADDHMLLSRLGERPKSVSEGASVLDTSGTDIVGALQFAGNLFRQDVLKHIVVITDGKQSDESDSNALKRQVDELADNNVRVSAIFLDDNLPSDVREIQLSSVDIADNAYLNRQQTVTVNIKCNGPDSVAADGSVIPYSAEAVLTLTREGAEVAKRTVYLSNGDNYETFTLSTSEAGVFDCLFTIDDNAEYDTNMNNNELRFTQQVTSGARVLLISDNYSDRTFVRDMFGEDAQVDDYVRISTVPCTVEELCRYDEIVLSDVDVTKLANHTMFLESLDTVVSLFGKSLVTLGNTYIQNYSTGELNALSDMLPVVYGQRTDAPRLFTIVFDTSRSMTYNARFQRAKEAAKEIVSLLSDSDYFSLVEFNGDAYTLHTAVRLENFRQDVLDTIDGLEVRQGTDIGSGMQAAFNIMRSSSAYSEKRIMLISDGHNLAEGTDLVDLTAEMVRYNIYTSTLDVEYDETTSAYGLLDDMAASGKGVHLDISTDESLESAIENELPTDVNNPNGGASNIVIDRRVDDLLDGVDQQQLAQNFVNGYYYGTAKASATTVLSLYYSVSQMAPLYSYWQYGNGRAACFTASVATGEGSQLGYWDEKTKTELFTSIFDVNIPEEKIDYPFVLDVDNMGGYTHVTLTPATVDMDATAEIAITLPDGTVSEGSMAFGSKSYDYEFVTTQVGDYAIQVTYTYGEGEDKSFTTSRFVNTSYKPEYDSFALFDEAVLHKMVGSNGTVSEDGSLEIVNEEGEAGTYYMPLAMPLLIAAVALFAVDIAVRKLKWDDIKGLFKKVNR